MVDWLGIPAGILAWSFAFYVFIVARGTTASRFLIGMLIVDGIAVISSFDNGPFVDEWLGVEGLNWWRIHQASDWAVVAVYLPFIGITLSSKLVAPLKSTKTRVAILLVGGVAAVSMFVLPMPVLDATRAAFYIVMSIVLAWGFLAAIHSWMTATSEARRARARAFTLAFGVRDVLWTWVFAMGAAHMYGYLPEGTWLLPWDVLVPLAYEVAVIIYVPLVAYDILRTQLFDIDLRIKRTLRRSTIAAAFVAAFFFVSEFAALYLSEQLGNLLGLLCTAALIFFLDPIQRAATRFADAAMPGTRATPEYETYRKLQVYEAAVQAALDEGGISDKERRMLDSLVGSLGIDLKTAQQLEDHVRASLVPAGQGEK